MSGKSIRGILNYNENKIKGSEAQLLLACGYPRSHEELSFKNKLERFELLTQQNEATKTNALHISLNFSVKDKIDDEILKSIALEYMNRIGFGGQPFLVYRHYDAAHPHIHIATVNIADGGLRLETHNMGKYQSERARKMIEEDFNLIKAEDQQKEFLFQLKPAKLKSGFYGKSETKATISSIVREVVASYKFTSLTELNNILKQFNVFADRGAPDSKMFERNGLVYCLLNENKQRVGVPIKASSIYNSPTLKNLETKYLANASARKPYGLRLKHQLDKAIKESKSISELYIRLQQQGIRVLLFENIQRKIYGLSFIDNATRTVFKGSDLGDNYNATVFMERINRIENFDVLRLQPEKLNDEITLASRTNYPATESPVFEKMLDIALSNQYEEYTPDPFRRKKNKRLQSE